MGKFENRIYQVLSVLLIIGIVVVVLDVIVPKYTNPSPRKILTEIDFSSADWIEDYAERSVGIFGGDFYVNTAFSYNVRSNKLVVTYATQKSVDEIREFYLELPGAELDGRNDETSLNVSAVVDGQKVSVYNYYSSISRVVELELILDQDNAQLVIDQLGEAYPDLESGSIPELEAITEGEFFGGYVRYSYDQLDTFVQPYTPIFSKAYYYDGTEEDFLSVIESMIDRYPGYQFDETQDVYRFKIQGQIVSLGQIMTDSGEAVVSIALQQGLPQR
jgi:hypothetical protein